MTRSFCAAVIVVETKIEVRVAAEARADVRKVRRHSEQWGEIHAGTLVGERRGRTTSTGIPRRDRSQSRVQGNQ